MLVCKWNVDAIINSHMESLSQLILSPTDYGNNHWPEYKFLNLVNLKSKKLSLIIINVFARRAVNIKYFSCTYRREFFFPLWLITRYRILLPVLWDFFFFLLTFSSSRLFLVSFWFLPLVPHFNPSNLSLPTLQYQCSISYFLNPFLMQISLPWMPLIWTSMPASLWSFFRVFWNDWL